VQPRDDTLVVGAMTRQSTIERRDQTEPVPLLGLAAPLIGHVQIRNRGTVGGSVAHADPAAEMPAVALALDAGLEVASPAGTRLLASSDFFVGNWTTVLGDDELLTALHYPIWSGRCGFAVDEVARRHGDFALTGVACGVQLDADDTVTRAAIALFGMGSTPVRAAAAEAALLGRRPDPDALDEVGRVAVAGLDPPEDIHASSRYRSVVGAHVVARGVRRAVEEARR
jgi:carbon-monoxide dehydrogenase medium subunit